MSGRPHLRIESLVAIWLFALAACIVHLMLFVWLCPGLGWDAASRYAPMAEEFAAGHFRGAFHPRFGVLFQVLSGALVFVTGCSGEWAVRSVATVSWCISAVPLWALARRIFDWQTAWIAAVLLWLCPEYWILASDGMRDDVRILSVVLMALGFLRTFRKEDASAAWGGLWMSTGLFISMTLRVDAYVCGLVLCLVYGLLGLRRRHLTAVGSVLATAVVATVLQSWMIYAYTGVFCPIVRLVQWMGGC